MLERSGIPVAFTGVFREDAEGLEPFMSWTAVRPGDADEVLGSLIDWDVKRANEKRASSLRHLAYRNDASYRKRLVERGFRLVRSMWTMLRELGEAEPFPEPPSGIRFTTLAEHPDEPALFRADQEAFAEHFGFVSETFDEWRARRFDDAHDDRERWLLALEDDQVVAFLREVTGGEMAQVAALGTRPRWRRRGIGTTLLRHGFADMSRRGHREVTLWVDSENGTGAVGLYEAVGMTSIVVDDTFQLDLRG
jgi:mycothiol synthase